MQSIIKKLNNISYNKIIFALLFLYIYCLQVSTQQDFNSDYDFPFVWNPNSASSLNNDKWLQPGQELVFGTTTSRPLSGTIFVNNRPANPTMVPFAQTATTPTPQFQSCFARCPTTSEYNPICASNRQLYGNEQKFNCARGCGLDIQIVRRGSCEGLFPMSRG